MFVSENEQPLLKYTQVGKFLTKTALEDLGFQAKICTDPELRSPVEIRTKLFLLREENEWSLSASESPSQEDQPTKKQKTTHAKKHSNQMCALLLFISKYLFFFLFMLGWLASYFLHKQKPCSLSPWDSAYRIIKCCHKLWRNIFSSLNTLLDSCP